MTEANISFQVICEQVDAQLPPKTPVELGGSESARINYNLARTALMYDLYQAEIGQAES